jgi:excisionase family DNA binding protein
MEPLTLTIADARRALGIGNTKLYQLIKTGQLDTIRLGRRRLVRTASLHRLIDACGESGDDK